MSIDKLFEKVLVENEYIDQHNFLVSKIVPELIIHHTDSVEEIKKKKHLAKQQIRSYGYFMPLYPAKEKSTENDEVAFLYPDSIGPEQDDEFLNTEAMSSTERMRRYNKRHPEKVRAYLKKTQKDRVARNRDRRKAVKKYGKSKMKNHDVHHPNGAKNGNWKLARKDHGRDKKNENIEYVYLSELMEGMVPNGPWQLIVEGGAAGHLAHPYEDDELTFDDVKEMIKRGLVGGLDTEAPVTEKLDGQNIMFTVRDGQVVFARNKSQVKSKGKNALDAAGLRQMFAGRGDIEKAFGGAAEDLQAAINALPEEERQKMFAEGSKFMNVEIIFPDTKNVIPYDKSVLVFHGTVEYDEEGNEVGRDINDSKTLSDAITRVNAQQQKTFGISGPRSIAFNDADTSQGIKKLQQYGAQLGRLQNEFGLDDKSTIEDYKRAWWNREIDNMGVDWTPEEKEGLITRWALGEKKFGVKNIEHPDKKKFFREFEANQLSKMQKTANRPLESIFLRVGADTLKRVTNFLSANNPQLAAALKQEVMDTIKTIQATDDENKLAKLQIQIERLEDIGMDNIVPSEGLVFMYNGKPYKFTGTFAPVNQILGTLKFAKGKAEETPVEPDKPKEEPVRTPGEKSEQPPEKSDQPLIGEPRTAAIFTGRFQPFHAGHYSIYRSMVEKFGKENVYIASSDKTDATTSPFNFSDKKEIMTRMFDIPEEMVVQVKNPYAPKEILEKLPPNTTYVTAVSQKDSERLAKGKYFKPYDETPETERKSFGDEGYYIIAPEMQLQVNGKNISGTQLRAVMGDPNITDRAKQEIFTKVYGKFDKQIFDKIVKTTTESEEALKITQMHTTPDGKPSKKSTAPKATAQKPVKPQVTKKPKKTKPETPKPETPTPSKPSTTQQKKSQSQTTQQKKVTDEYKPGETWRTDSGNYGGKNSKYDIKYFGTLDKAKLFAQK